MATDVLNEYRSGAQALPESYRLWPLYGAGLENLGKDGTMLEVPLVHPGPDELLVRHDACGICFSDVKVIRTGQNHPRIHRDMSQIPVVLGHEVTLTIIEVGENLRDQYQPGQRFIVQADIYLDGIAYAYGYEIQGGFSQFSVIDWRVLNGDDGNYLIPVQPSTGYAEAALNEPWACVIASYTVKYRDQWKEGGAVWVVGDGAGVSLGKAQAWRPRALVMETTDPTFNRTLREWAGDAGVTVGDADQGERMYDDIVVLSNDPDLIERAFKRLANGGTFAIVTDKPIERRVQLDIGRIHYDNLALMGTTSSEIGAAYTPIRTDVKAGGRMLAIGAAGPMGQMHVQRGLELQDHPVQLVASDLVSNRLGALSEKFGATAQEQGIELVTLARDTFPDQASMDAALRNATGGEGFDDIVVLAPATVAVEGAYQHLAENAVMNIFAGLPRGTMCGFDANLVTQRGVRFTGTSGSSIGDLREMLALTESHELATNRSVAAVAGLEGFKDGLRAVIDGRFAGKVVIYPNIGSLPLTPIEELGETLPGVAAKLAADGSWTNAAEAELLRELL